VTCGACGRDNRADAQFCDNCGRRLEAVAPQSGEFRQVTTMFCDIVDYTRLAGRIDEEELHRLIATYQGAVADIVSRWDGDVDFYAGDGVSACFGYPRAHEDDAERAVRAGLDVVQAMRSLTIPSETGQVMALPIRVGIHSGRAMVGELGSGERRKRQPIGTAMNVAARLQAFAQAGTVVISQSTEQLVSGRFLTEDIGGLSLKGMDAPVRAYVIRRGVGTTGQTDAHRTSATPVVGRSRELARLQQCWSDARAGRGQVVLVSGEPGIGKSKLVRRFVDDIARDDDRSRRPAREGRVYEPGAGKGASG
jgi:class 3 adenylate cyclase